MQADNLAADAPEYEVLAETLAYALNLRTWACQRSQMFFGSLETTESLITTAALWMVSATSKGADLTLRKAYTMRPVSRGWRTR